MAYLQRTVLQNPWIKVIPFPKQAAFLQLVVEEAFFGGASGPGKSYALLMGALQHVDIPGYSAIIFRQTMPHHNMAGGLIPVSHQWLGGSPDVAWNGTNHQWTWSNGASLKFASMEVENDKYNFKGMTFHYVAFDELTDFSETQYQYLFSRMRRTDDMNVPVRMRAGSNPGSKHHEWVKRYFILNDRRQGRIYIPAKLEDNLAIDKDGYLRFLNKLDPITRAQMRDGDWSARAGGTKFRREWFEILAQAPSCHGWVRFWDLAGTEKKEGNEPDWSVGALCAKLDGRLYVRDVRRTRGTPFETTALIKQTARVDGRNVAIRIEEEGGASGKFVTDMFAREHLFGYDFKGIRSTGDKEIRANPLSSMAQAGNVKLIEGPWISDFLEELDVFPQAGFHDDQVDAVSGALAELGFASAAQFEKVAVSRERTTAEERF